MNLRQESGLPADPQARRLRETLWWTLFAASLDDLSVPAAAGTARYRNPAWGPARGPGCAETVRREVVVRRIEERDVSARALPDPGPCPVRRRRLRRRRLHRCLLQLHLAALATGLPRCRRSLRHPPQPHRGLSNPRSCPRSPIQHNRGRVGAEMLGAWPASRHRGACSCRIRRSCGGSRLGGHSWRRPSRRWRGPGTR